MGMLECVFFVCVWVSAHVCVCMWEWRGGAQAGSWGVEYSRAFSLSKSRRETSLEAWSSSCCTSKPRRVFLNREGARLFSTVQPQLTNVYNRPVNWNKMEMVFAGVVSVFCACQSFITAPFFYPGLDMHVCLKGRKCHKKMLHPSSYSLHAALHHLWFHHATYTCFIHLFVSMNIKNERQP